MAEEIEEISETTPGVEQTDKPKAESAENSYTLTEEDERELEMVRQQRAILEQRLGKLDPRSPHLEGLKKTFQMGPGGNRRSGGTQFRKRFGASIDRAARLSPLYEERLRLLAQEKALLTGARAKEREREVAQQKERQEAAQRVREARVGDYVHDSAYGTVRVVRVNTQSLTIETETGRREPRKFSLIERMAFTEEEIIDWFVKRDVSGRFPIRAYVHEALFEGKSIEEMAIWLKDETYTRYPVFIRNLPWQKIAQHFHNEDCRHTSTSKNQNLTEEAPHYRKGNRETMDREILGIPGPLLLLQLLFTL